MLFLNNFFIQTTKTLAGFSKDQVSMCSSTSGTSASASETLASSHAMRMGIYTINLVQPAFFNQGHILSQKYLNFKPGKSLNRGGNDGIACIFLQHLRQGNLYTPIEISLSKS